MKNLEEKLVKTFKSCKEDFERFARLYKAYGGNDHLCAAMDYYGRAHMVYLILVSDFGNDDVGAEFNKMKEMERELEV